MTPRKDPGTDASDASMSKHKRLIASIVFAICLPMTLGLVRSYSIRLKDDERMTVRSELEARGTTLMSEVNRRQALLIGLDALAVTSGTVEELAKFFVPFARALVGDDDALRMVQIFPREGSCLFYPVAGNEAVAGRTLNDLLADPRPNIMEDVGRTVSSGKTSMSTPYELRQGGIGLVSRLAIYDDASTFLGVAVVILDFPSLLRTSGFEPDGGNLRHAIRDSNGAVFYGDRGVLDADPVSYRIDLPENYWIVSAVPVAGWGTADRAIVVFLYLLAFFSAAIFALVIFLQQQRVDLLRKTLRLQERDLSENSVRIRQAAEAANIGFFDLNRATDTVTFSSEWSRLFDRPGESSVLTMKDWTERVHPEDREAFLGSIASGESGAPPDRRAEFRFRVNDGTYRWVLMKAAPLAAGPGESERILGANLDITETRLAADKIRLLNAELEGRIREWADGLGQLFPTIETGPVSGSNVGREDSDARMSERLEELRKWHAVTLGREQRIIELKAEVNALLVRAGSRPKYSTPKPYTAPGNGGTE